MPPLHFGRRAAMLGAVGTALAPVAAAWPRTLVGPGAGLDAGPLATPADFERIDLWDGGLPGTDRRDPANSAKPRDPGADGEDVVYTEVGTPMLFVLRPRVSNGAALLMIPGGAYHIVAAGLEGFAVSRRMVEAGYTCFTLVYRLPGHRQGDDFTVPLQDAQRAMRLVRSLGASHGFAPKRVGVVGFSAGGHLAGWLSTRQEPAYAPRDAVDRQAARPAFTALIYPVITMTGAAAHAGSREQLLGPSPAEDRAARLSLQNAVSARTPPTFLVHALDDPAVPADNSLAMLAALRRQGIACECHLFETGGHGFGLAPRGAPAARWPELLTAFARRHGG
ncbi:alpha/beta hydrolase [Novosphingobium resinovorum]|uniref:alpha/beta hydrolase n=1 Tax=Novosphingobium resinovorum TaxID=158500 RepID=UPI002ED19B9F|nr:alpha/beta hydrolase [Novosphingobium resinovorum]